MIYIDASRYNNTLKRTGVENYSVGLINALAKLAPDDITLIAPRPVPLGVRQITIPFWRAWTQARLSWEIHKNPKIDNLFVPSHVMPLVHPKNTVLTIHDVAWNHDPESYSMLSRFYLEWTTRFALRHARAIVVPSESTKQDLLYFYHADPRLIHVVLPGFEPTGVHPDRPTQKKILASYFLEPGRYFFYLGRVERKKNIDRLIQAFEAFAEKSVEIKLVLAGSLGYGWQEIMDAIPPHLRAQVIQTGYVSETTKAALFENALAFVFPSRQEGFGLPILEALHYRLPIIASNIPALRAVAREAALYFDPDDVNMLGVHLQRVATNQALREKLVAHAAALLKPYSWKKCAEQVLELLRKF